MNRSPNVQQNKLEEKLTVNFILGNKNQQAFAKQTPCGEQRIYDHAFWDEINEKTNTHLIHLNPPPRFKIPFSETLGNILYHFQNVLQIKKTHLAKGINHIYFEEESSILRFLPLKKSVVTCLDIIPIAFPYQTSAHYKLFYSTCVKGLKKADHIFTASNHTKSDLIKHLNIPKEKITTAYWGINEIFKPRTPSENFYQKFQLNPKKIYLTSVGGLNIPRKNLILLVDALPEIIKKFPNTELILTGYQKKKGTPLAEKIAASQVKNKIHILSGLNDAELVELYNASTIFLFPTLYEGFGLPPVEAMACGTPVIAANNSSIPEAVGNAGILFQNNNIHDLIAQTCTLLQNEHLQKELRDKGFQHAKTFTWKNYTKTLLETYPQINS